MSEDIKRRLDELDLKIIDLELQLDEVERERDELERVLEWEIEEDYEYESEIEELRRYDDRERARDMADALRDIGSGL